MLGVRGAYNYYSKWDNAAAQLPQGRVQIIVGGEGERESQIFTTCSNPLYPSLTNNSDFYSKSEPPLLIKVTISISEIILSSMPLLLLWHLNN